MWRYQRILSTVLGTRVAVSGDDVNEWVVYGFFLRKPVSTCVTLVAMMFVRQNERGSCKKFLAYWCLGQRKFSQGFTGPVNTRGSARNEGWNGIFWILRGRKLAVNLKYNYKSSEILQRERGHKRLRWYVAIRLSSRRLENTGTRSRKSEGLLQLTASLAVEKILAGCLGFFKTKKINPCRQESALAFPSFIETARLNYTNCQLALKTAALFHTFFGCLGLRKTRKITPRSRESAMALQA